MTWFQKGFGLAEPVPTEELAHMLSPHALSWLRFAITTGDFDAIGRMERNCAAAAVANALLYEWLRERSSHSDILDIRREILSATRREVGNGPVLPWVLRLFFPKYSQRAIGRIVRLQRVSSMAWKAGILGGKMGIILASEHPLSAHYMSAVAWDGAHPIVFDGWHHDALWRMHVTDTLVIGRYLVTSDSRSF